MGEYLGFSPAGKSFGILIGIVIPPSFHNFNNVSPIIKFIYYLWQRYFSLNIKFMQYFDTLF